MKTLGSRQRIYLEAIASRSPGDVLNGSWDISTTETIGMSLARLGLVDGPTERPAVGYAQHDINSAGRLWVHDNVGHIVGRRFALTGLEVPWAEFDAYLADCVAAIAGGT